jgi:serpin B
MPSAFEAGQADFSGMDGSRDLLIEDVVHHLDIDVGEIGVMSVAKKSARIEVSSAPINLEVHANRPFIFFVYDMPTSTIVLMGRIIDPSLGSAG